MNKRTLLALAKWETHSLRFLLQHDCLVNTKASSLSGNPLLPPLGNFVVSCFVIQPLYIEPSIYPLVLDVIDCGSPRAILFIVDIVVRSSRRPRTHPKDDIEGLLLHHDDDRLAKILCSLFFLLYRSISRYLRFML